MVGKTKLVSRLCLIAIYNTFSNRWIIKKMCWTIFIYLYASPLYLYFKFGNDEWDPYKFALLYIMRKLNFQLSYVLKLNRQNRRNKKVRFSWHLVPLISTSFSQLIAADVRYLRPKHNRHKNNIYFRTIGSSNGIARTWKRRYLFAVYNTFWTRWIINKMLNNIYMLHHYLTYEDIWKC